MKLYLYLHFEQWLKIIALTASTFFCKFQVWISRGHPYERKHKTFNFWS